MFDAFAEVSKLPKTDVVLPIDRLRRTFGKLWERISASRTKVVHVVGSNGKGSTAAFLDQLLRRMGLKTGLYTSPHYFEFEERIQIDGRPVANRDLEEAWRYFAERAGPPGRFGGFEAMTVMAAFLFARADSDVLIVEAGIGGRYDPTRLFGGSLALLTSVDLEHTAILGRSVEEIAADKIDVVVPGGTVITGWLEPSLQAFCETYVQLSRRHLKEVTADYRIDAQGFAGRSTVRVASPALPGNDCIEYSTPAGYFIRNSILALRAAERLLPEGTNGNGLSLEFAGLCRTFGMPGRFEKLLSSPPLYCDVAHTPGAIRDVIETCKCLFPAGPPIFVVGMSVDKNYPEMCRLLAAYGTRFLAFPAAHKGESPEILATHLRASNPQAGIEIFASARAVAAHLHTAAYSHAGPVVATGGLFSAIEFRTAVRGGDPSALNFY